MGPTGDGGHGNDPQRNVGQSTFSAPLLAVSVGGIGGVFFLYLNLPLPWMLGALTASAMTAIAGLPWMIPSGLRDVARPVIGVLAGGAFTPAVIQTLPQWWGALIVVALYTVVALIGGLVFFTRFAGFDRVTAFFSAAPGGLAELTLMGSSFGGNLRQMALVHSMRIICVLVLLPVILQFFVDDGLRVATTPGSSHNSEQTDAVDWAILIACGLAGYALGKRLRIPGGVLLPALILSAAVHGAGWTSATPPQWLVAAVQVIIGSAAGARFFGIRPREAMGAIVWGSIWAVIMIASTLAVATATAAMLDQSLDALILAFAPGGTAEMTILAYALGIEVAFVVTCQVSRIMLVYTLAPIIFALLRRSGRIRTRDDR